MADDFGGNDVGNPVQPCPSKNTEPVYWLEIEMVGQDGSPIPYAEYRVVKPDGDAVRGYLDKNGWARLDGLDSSSDCKVSFPEFDKDAWKYVEALGARESGES
jgi:hypothetical protein